VTEISGKTKIAALFGYPVEHTKSPRMQNAAFAAMRIDACYVAFSVPPQYLPGAVEGIRSLGLIGVNLTIPHKEAVLSLLDEIDSEAQFIGAVNTIVNQKGRLSGFNTDGRGFMRSLAESGITVQGKRLLMLGAGGAARAIGFYLAREAASLTIVNRTRSKAELLAADLNSLSQIVSVADCTSLDHASFFEEVDIIINTTALGLKSGDQLPMKVTYLKPHHVVCDLIYHDTPLLKSAEAKGVKVLNGLGMLLWQGALAFELWTNQKAPVEIMRKAIT
jgi:shikimate dehydrogenase